MELTSILSSIYVHRFIGSIASLQLDQEKYITEGLRQDDFDIVATEQIISDNEADPDLEKIKDDFIRDIVTMSWLNQCDNKSKSIFSIQVKWQNRIDKFNPDPLTSFYLGCFHLNIGITLEKIFEYELAITQYAKGEKYFANIGVSNCLQVIHVKIAHNYEMLGADGEARYHLRHLLRLSPDVPLIQYSYSKLVESYDNSGMEDKAEEFKILLNDLE